MIHGREDVVPKNGQFCSLSLNPSNKKNRGFSRSVSEVSDVEASLVFSLADYCGHLRGVVIVSPMGQEQSLRPGGVLGDVVAKSVVGSTELQPGDGEGLERVHGV